jgi:hypothetical protein
MTHTTSNPKIHEGRNLKRFRELLSLKQDAFCDMKVAHFDSEHSSVS